MSKLLLLPLLLVGGVVGTLLGIRSARAGDEDVPSDDAPPTPAGAAPPPADPPPGGGASGGVPGAGAGPGYGIVGGGLKAGGEIITGVVEQAAPLDEERHTTLRAAREEYQTRARALGGALRDLARQLDHARKGGDIPAGTQAAGDWLAAWLQDQGWNADDRRTLVYDRLELRRKLRSGSWVWKDFPVAQAWERLNAAANEVHRTVTNNRSREPAGIVAAHRGAAGVWGDLASGPVAALWRACEEQLLALQALVTDSAELVDQRGEV